ncbi:MAG TPA: hypothetical protein DEG43_01745 [Acidimicrobiaceae bacterium]|jgi:uncharacterized membrane protein YdbT with pleckstrin-like domain|nr:hypothetical protein [Acidimicrobiaceae bacterium]
MPRASMLVGTVVVAGAFLLSDLTKDTDARVPLQWLMAAFILAALIYFLIRVMGWRTTNFVVTSDRCIYRTGVLKKEGIEIPLDRINTVFFSQTVFERILKAGDLAIESAGEGSRQNFSDVYDPVGVQNVIYQQMEDDEARKYSRIGDEARSAAESVVGSAQLSVAEQLEKLADLRDRGAISAADFDAEKQRLLGG